ncbi:MAG: hypothetical protein WAK95_16945 [Desulfobacterales bacterium]
MTRMCRQAKSGWLAGLWVLAGLFLLAGCGGARQVKSDLPGIDREFDRYSRMARAAFDTGQIPQAIEGYNKALARAYVTDDIDGIVDTGYNLAVSHLQLGDYAAALENVEKVRGELLAAGRDLPADLLFVQAAALYQTGDPERAWQISEDILAMPPTPGTPARTHFLRGLLAADRGDAAQLRLEITALGEPALPGLKADHLELTGRLAMLDGRWDEAVAALDQAARVRAENRNYRSMETALAAAALASQRAQRPADAAYRYLRAARSAALSGDPTRATAWLHEAGRLAGQAGAESILAEVRGLQALLSEESPPRPVDR